MYKTFLFLSLLIFTVSSCDDDNELRPGPLKLEKSNVTFDAQATNTTIKVSGEGWQFAGLEVNDSIYSQKILPDTITQSWFTVIKQNKGKSISVNVEENKGKERSFKVFLDAGGVGTKLTVIQKEK